MKTFGPFTFDIFDNVEKHGPSSLIICKNLLLSSSGKWLAREACDVYVAFWGLTVVAVGDVFVKFVRVEIGFYHFRNINVDVAANHMLEIYFEIP